RHPARSQALVFPRFLPGHVWQLVPVYAGRRNPGPFAARSGTLGTGFCDGGDLHRHRGAPAADRTDDPGRPDRCGRGVARTAIALQAGPDAGRPRGRHGRGDGGALACPTTWSRTMSTDEFLLIGGMALIT